MKKYPTTARSERSLYEYLIDQVAKGLNYQRAHEALEYYKGILNTHGYSPSMFKILECIIAAWLVIYIASLANQPVLTAPTGAAPTPHYPVQPVAPQSEEGAKAHEEEISEELKRLKEYRYKPNVY